MDFNEEVKLKTKLYKFCGIDSNRDWSVLPELLHSLDAQHQYLWPKLRELGFMIRYQYSQLRDNDTGELISDWTYYCSIYDIAHKRGIQHFEYRTLNKESPSIACALTIEKLIDKEVNK